MRREKGGKEMRAVKQIATAVLTVIFSLLLISHTAFSNFYGRTDDQEIFHYPCNRLILEEHSQNPEGEYWENLKGSNFPLTLMDWQLVTKLGSRDKYMNKRVVGTVRNNSNQEFSEVKVEFTVYDEQGNQIAIVFSDHYDFKPGGIWKFQIPVTEDVGKAELKGLYIPEKELRELEKK
jgi:hypothetical protein